MKGIVVTPEGEISVQEFHAPLHKTVGDVVGNHMAYVKPARLPEPYCLIVNEDGLLLNLRPNPHATWLYGGSMHKNPIVGTIVVMKIDMTPEGHGIIGLTDEETEAMRKYLAADSIAEMIRRNE